MAIQYINTGSGANAGNGDSLRSAFIKVNNNFAYLSTATSGGGNGYTGSIGYTGSQGDIGYTGSAGQGIVNFGDQGRIPFYDSTGTVLSPSSAMKFTRGTTSSFPIIQFGDDISNPRFVFTRNTYTGLSNMVEISQYHNNPDANNFAYIRARGTLDAPENVQVGDDLVDISFLGYNNIPMPGAGLGVVVEGIPGLSGQIPAKIEFGTSNGTVFSVGAALSSSSTWKINKLSHLNSSATSIIVSASLIPESNITYDLGSTSSQWRSLYVSSSTIYIDNKALSIDANNNITINGEIATGGYTGSRGYTGSKGYTGSSGIQGYSGSQGELGYTGSKGDLGYTGSRGDTGYVGSQGDIGYAGSQGTNGLQGNRGYTGSEGAQGSPGQQGQTGAQGVSVTLVGSTSTSAGLPLTGNAGDGWIVNDTGNLWFWSTVNSQWEDIGQIVGPQGDLGYTGSQGTHGDIGLTGDQGYTGSQGDVGYVGSQGDVGYVGSQGELGYVGSQGDVGYVGSQGETGYTGSQANIGNFVFTDDRLSVSDDGDITVVTNANTWTFSAGGTLTVPSQVMAQTGNQLALVYNRGEPVPGFDADVAALFLDGVGALIEVTNSGTSHTWSFDPNGVLTLPSGNTRIGDVFGVGNDIILGSTDTSIGVIVQGPGAYSSLQWVDNIDNIGEIGTQVAAVVVNSAFASSSGTVQIATGAINGPQPEHIWEFGADGRLTLPGGEAWVEVSGSGGVSILEGEYAFDDIPVAAIKIGGTEGDAFTISSYDDLVKTWLFNHNGNLTVPGHILPSTDLAYDLGSTSSQWRSIHVGTGTIYIGGVALGVNQDNYVTVDGNPIITVNTAGNITIQGDSVLTPVTISAFAPPADVEGNLWYNNLDGRTYVAYAGQWVDANPTVVPTPETYLGNISIDGDTLNINGSTLTINTSGTLLVNGSEVSGSGYGATLTASATDPMTSTGTLWFNTVEGRTYLKYNDQWVDVNPTVVPLPSTYLDEITIDGSTINMNGSTLAINTAGVLLVNGEEVTGSGGSVATLTNGSFTLSLDDSGVLVGGTGTDVTVIATTGSNTATWTFSANSSLTIPGPIVSEGYQLELAGSQASYDLGRYLLVRDGDYVSHIHIDSPDNSTYDLFLGDDSKYVKVDHEGPVVIGNNGNANTWTFAVDGGLVFPDGTDYNQRSAYLSGQQTVYVNSTSTLTDINLLWLEGSVIVISPEAGYTTTGETHNIYLPFSTSGIALGTRITVISQYNGTVNVGGWPGPGYTLAQYTSIELVYYYDPTDTGSYWWVTNSFSW